MTNYLAKKFFNDQLINVQLSRKNKIVNGQLINDQQSREN